MVAWHEVPGKKQKRCPSQRDGMMAITAGRDGAQRLPRLTSFAATHRSHRALRDGSHIAAHPGTSCLATIISSLRDSSD